MKTKIYNKEIMKIISAILMCLITSGFLMGQDYDPSNIVIPPSPTASSIAKYGDIPVGLYTGIPNINVPLYQFKSRLLSVPITLNYHAGGHKVDAVSGWTGLGWSLSCNYVITRSVRGAYADEVANGYKENPIMVNFDGGILNINDYPYEVQDMAEGKLDGEPDLFHFSFPGGSGSFVYDFNNDIAHIQPYQDTRIKWLGEGEGFLITDTNGHKYTFNDTEQTKVESIDCASPMGGATNQTTGWYLTKVVEVNEMDEISFTYDNYEINYPMGVNQTSFFDNPSISNVCKKAPQAIDCVTNLNTKGRRLTSISSPYTGTVSFLSSGGREDLNGGRKLDEIKVENNGNLIRRFNFNYDYFDSSGQTGVEGDPSVYKRLRLLSVSDIPASGDNNPPFVFTYEENVKLPPRLSYNQDHWGYANGKNNLTMLPSRILTELPFNGGDRNTNSEMAEAGMLKRIDYPTGGYNEFEYESNSWGSFNEFNLLQYSSAYVNKSVNLLLDTSAVSPAEISETFNLPHGVNIGYDVKAYTIDPTLEWNGRITLMSDTGDGFCQEFYPEGLFCDKTDGYPDNQVSGSMWIPAGTYTLFLANLSSSDITKVDLYWEQHEIYTDSIDINTVDEIFVGGARIKTLTTGDGLNPENDQVKNYEYKQWDHLPNTNLSSGKLVTTPRYLYLFKEYRPLAAEMCDRSYCSFRGLTSSSKAPLGTSQGSHIAYTNVTVFEGENKELGKSESTFSFTGDKGGTGFPYGPQTSYDYKRGLLMTQVESRGSEGNYEEVRRIENSYNFREESQVNHSQMIGLNVAYNIQGQNQCPPQPTIICTEENTETEYYSYDCNLLLALNPLFQFLPICDPIAFHPCYGLTEGTTLTNVLFTNQFAYRSYAFLSNWFSLESTVETIDGVEKITLYEYDEIEGRHTNITSTKVKNSDGDWYSTKMEYAHERSGIDDYAFDMVQRNMVAVPLKVSQETDGILTGGRHTLMRGAYWKFLPKEIYQILPDGSELLRTTILYHNDGFPRKQLRLSGQNETYTWNNGRLASRTLLDNWTWSYDYDPTTWQLKKLTNFDGLSNDFTYDGYQRLDAAISKANGNVKSTTNYNYQIGGGNNVVSQITSFPDGTTTQTNASYYDGLGRPFKADINGITKQETQYDELGRVAAQTYLPGIFKEIKYEASPLKRPTSEIYPDGTMMTTDYGASGNYYEQIITDENGNTTTTKTDILGRQESLKDDLGGVTANIYDIRSNLKQVNPPAGDPYVYGYDLRNRVAVKTIPGSGEQRFLYNEKDLLVASQDANMLADGRWLVTEYDEYNRPIASGFYNGDATIADLNTIVPQEILTETFYDSYDNLIGFPADLGGGAGCSTGAILQGKVVGTKVNILDEKDPGSEWIFTINCIDEYGRIAGVKSNNHLDGKDVISSTYDLADNVLMTQHNHEISGNSMLISREFNYDEFFRVTKTWHQVNDGPKPMVSWSQYNDQDLLQTKYLGYNENSELALEYLQKIDYEYNVRGWLTKINDVDELPTEELPICDDEIDPPTCPPTCDYSVALPCGESTLITAIYVNGGQLMNLNYPLGCFNTNLIRESIIGWLNANGGVYDAVQVYINGAGDLVITILGSKVIFNFVSAPSIYTRDDDYIFIPTNCGGKVDPTGPCDICKDAGYDCERCPLFNIQDPCTTCTDLGLPCLQCDGEAASDCEICEDIGFANCEQCPLTVEAIAPMRINIAYNLAELTSSNPKAYLIHMNELSRHFLHDGGVKDIVLDKMILVGDGVTISDFNPLHLMELEIFDQTIVNDNLEEVIGHVLQMVEEELTIAGITDQVAIDLFTTEVELALNTTWTGQATADNPLDPQSSAANPDLFAMDIYYNEGNSITGTSGQKNGNISGITWATHSGQRQTYGFSYDGINRLKWAKHASEITAGVWDSQNKYGMNATYDAVGNIMTLNRNGVSELCESPTGTLYDYAKVDELMYYYNSDNRMYYVSNNSNAEHGFKGVGGTVGHDNNGNMTNVGYKNSTLQYNHLNLPYQMMKQEDGIDWKYTADGAKLQKQVNAADPTASYTKDYINGIEYRNANFEATYFEDGRVTYDGKDWHYEYYLKDHLGNNRVVFSDYNENGYLEPFAQSFTAVPEDYSEMFQENHYYPFGMGMEGPWEQVVSDPNNGYRYNGKELNEEFGLDWLDYGARWYDASIGRFSTTDRYAEKYTNMAPYQYGANNPISNIDINGDSIWITTNQKTGNWVLNFTGKILNASGSNSTVSASKFMNEFSSAINKIGGPIEVNIDFKEVNSMDEVESSDHLFVFVDKIDEGGNGVSNRTGKVSYIKAGRGAKTMVHEAGHLMGLSHPGDGIDGVTDNMAGNNIMGYPFPFSQDYRDMFSKGQWNSFQKQCDACQLNIRGNSSTLQSGESGFNYYYREYIRPTSSNSKPYRGAGTTGMKMPRPIKY